MHISNKCSVAVHCLLFIHEYGQQTRVTSELLSKSTGSNPVTIRSILSALKKAGVLSIPSGTGGAVLSCPPEEIDLCRVCSALEPDFAEKLVGVHAQPSQLCPVGRDIHRVLGNVYCRVQEDLRASLRSITLADVIADYHQSP